MVAFEIVSPPDDCQSSPRPFLQAGDGYCAEKFDHFLCWPSIKGNKTVAIPCNASVAFVALVTSKSSSDEQSEIPGNFS